MSIWGFNLRHIASRWCASMFAWIINIHICESVPPKVEKGEAQWKVHWPMVQYGWSQNCRNWGAWWHGVDWIGHENYRTKHSPLEDKVCFSPIKSFDVIVNIQLLMSCLCFSSFRELTCVLGVYFLRIGFLT